MAGSFTQQTDNFIVTTLTAYLNPLTDRIAQLEQQSTDLRENYEEIKVTIKRRDMINAGQKEIIDTQKEKVSIQSNDILVPKEAMKEHFKLIEEQKLTIAELQDKLSKQAEGAKEIKSTANAHPMLIELQKTKFEEQKKTVDIQKKKLSK